MIRRLARLVIAFLVALAATMPAGASAVPMQAMMGVAAVHQCPSCPDHSGTTPASDKLAACPLLACASAAALVPTPALLPDRAVLRATYVPAIPTGHIGLVRTPDPFPPRPIALV